MVVSTPLNILLLLNRNTLFHNTRNLVPGIPVFPDILRANTYAFTVSLKKTQELILG